MSKLTTETLGHMVPVAWIATTGQAELPSKRDIVGLLIEGENEAPEAVRRLLHVEYRLDGPVVKEYSTILAAAQASGLVSRDNPSNVSARGKVDQIQAQNLMDQWSIDFPDETEWLTKVFRRFYEDSQDLPSVHEHQ
ncbi:MAG: hypothetical protein IPK13_10080 [Deltaproteobacteria bacterium]|nr:hypothetical protein [Deltaproteobacteria bacterium]